MKHKFNRNASIEIMPESEIEVYALHNFIAHFKSGWGEILIHKDELGEEKLSIKADPKTGYIVFKEIRKSE